MDGSSIRKSKSFHKNPRGRSIRQFSAQEAAIGANGNPLPPVHRSGELQPATLSFWNWCLETSGPSFSLLESSQAQRRNHGNAVGDLATLM